jgi:DNA-binding MarR family transcriptional regulator
MDSRASSRSAELAADLRLAVRRFSHRLRLESQDDELTISQRSALGRIGDGQITLSELASAENVRPQSISMTVAHLEKAGLVRRRPDPDDGRAQLLSLTKAGSHKLEQSRADRNAWLARAIERSCSSTERRALIEALPILIRLAESE